MAYTLATIRNRVYTDKLDDTSIASGTIDNFINDTQREIFNTYELPFQEKVFLGNLPPGASIYTLPTDHQTTQSMVLTNANQRLDLTRNYVDFRDFNYSYPTPDQYTAGAPSLWTLYGNQLYFSRPTDTTYTISLFYLKTAKTLSGDTDVPEIPEEFSELLVLGAYIRALEFNENFDQAAFVRGQDFNPLLDLMVARLSERQTGKPSVIRQTHRGGRGYHRRRH